jgi:hypothetical protein
MKRTWLNGIEVRIYTAVHRKNCSALVDVAVVAWLRPV